MSFEIKNYVIEKNFIEKDICTLLYTYSKIRVMSSEHKYIYYPHLYHHRWDADLNDLQCPNTFSYYGDPIMESILLCVKEKIESLINLKLTPNYSFWRFYEKGDSLKYHLDRESCEISATICLGYDTSNINNEKWPMFIESNDVNAVVSKTIDQTTYKDITKKGIPIFQEPGDILIYKGGNLAHWRETFKGLNQTQLFIHYNDINNLNLKPLDGRPIPGIPGLKSII
jgi:hypothetical protein